MDSEVLDYMDACKKCHWWNDYVGKCKKPSERLVSPERGNIPAIWQTVDCPKDVKQPQKEEAIVEASEDIGVRPRQEFAEE